MAGQDRGLADFSAQLAAAELLLAATGPWEVEIGFGKGRYLLGRAVAEPARRFLGVEVAGEYQAILAGRAARRGLRNLVAVRGEALYLLSAVLPRGWAEAVHVYFPDPWPKSRQKKRRLFDVETVDLVLGLLAPGGRLCFATDFLEYGALVEEILRGFPGLVVERVEGGWPEGPRTNYEAKYLVEGRPILRLVARFEPTPDDLPLHPLGRVGVLCACGDGSGTLFDV